MTTADAPRARTPAIPDQRPTERGRPDPNMAGARISDTPLPVVQLRLVTMSDGRRSLPLSLRGARARRIARAGLVGAGAGLLGTLAMSTLMLPAQWLGLLGTQPPRRVADRLLVGTAPTDRASESERRLATTAAHLGIGSAAGALLGAGRAATDHRGPGAVVGALFGSAFWAVNYILVAPAFRLFPPPWRDRPGRPPVMLTANAIFGLVSCMVIDRALRRPRAGGPWGRSGSTS